MPRLPGHIRVLCVAAAAALLAAGCSGSGGSGAVGGLEKTADLVVAAVPAEDSTGLYIAQQRGYFAQEGLHVQIVPAISGARTSSMGRRRARWRAASVYPSYILADQAQHDKLKLLKVLVAGSTMAPNVQEIVVPPGSKITKMSQLAGKTITLNALDNIGQLLVASMLQDNAVKGGVHYNVQSFPAMGKLLAEHKLTAAWLPEPFISMDEEKYGVEPLADANQGAAESLPIEGYVVTQSWLNKYPHTAEAFRIAMEKAQAVAASDTDAVQKSMTAFAQVPQLASSVLPPPGFPTDTQAGPLQRVITLMVNLGLTNQGYNAANLIAKIPNP